MCIFFSFGEKGIYGFNYMFKGVCDPNSSHVADYRMYKNREASWNYFLRANEYWFQINHTLTRMRQQHRGDVCHLIHPVLRPRLFTKHFSLITTWSMLTEPWDARSCTQGYPGIFIQTQLFLGCVHTLSPALPQRGTSLALSRRWKTVISWWCHLGKTDDSIQKTKQVSLTFWTVISRLW